jgi:Nucleotide modification associated domain 1
VARAYLINLNAETENFCGKYKSKLPLRHIMEKTLTQFRQIMDRCQALFMAKTKDYGTAWRILRTSSITDQLYIKALRIRSIEEKGTQKVEDSIASEYVGLINYSILALIQMELTADAPLELAVNEVAQQYQFHLEENIRLLRDKNHDYGEAWRQMRISSMTDLILQKLLRIKQIEDNAGQTLVSEGLAANYRDIINYAVFALIKMEQQ